MSEEDSASSSAQVIDQRKFKIKTDKENDMELSLRIYNNDEFGISILSLNKYPSKKYELKCSLEQIQKNRFFKIFVNLDEIFKELETKIEKTIFIEEDNNIHMEIDIGLTVINQIELEIKQTVKTKEETIDELSKKIENLEEQIDQLNQNYNNLNNQKTNKENELNNIIYGLKNQIKELIQEPKGKYNLCIIIFISKK